MSASASLGFASPCPMVSATQAHRPAVTNTPTIPNQAERRNWLTASG